MSQTILSEHTCLPGDADLRGRNRETVEKYLSMHGDARTERYLLFTEDGRGGLRTTDSGEPIQAVGRDALKSADAQNSQYFPGFTWSDVQIFDTQDPNRFWAECSGTGTVRFPAYPEAVYTNHYIHSFVMEDGLIKEYWEYMNPCAEFRALGIEVPTVERPFV